MKIVGPIPPHIARLMAKEDRQDIGALTTEEIQQHHEERSEKKMHMLFSDWLRLHEIPALHCRMDRKSTIQNGWPDFTILIGGGRCVCIEMKVNGNQLSEDQKTVIAMLEKNGTPVSVCRSVEEAIEFVEVHQK